MATTTKVPFVDLQANGKPLKAEILAGISAVLDKCNYIMGEEVQKFETEFAKYCGSAYAVGCANGTEALHLAMRAAGIGPGDEVIVPAHTFIATALGVTYSGARPVLVDIDPETFLIDPDRIEKAVTSRTKAILPVHLNGRMTDLEPLLDICKRKKLTLIEDSAQSHGAELKGRRAGTVGAMGCFSFYPGKNLGAYGDAGAVITSDPALKAKLEGLRNYGSPKKYHHPEVGFNSRLDTIQAVVLSAKLPHLDTYNRKRYEAAVKYNQLLKGVGDVTPPAIPEKKSHVFHLYPIRTKKRDALLKFLGDNGVGAGIHYPTPIHLHGAYQDLGYRRGDFPVAEAACDEIVSLPMFPEITDTQIEYTVEQVRKFFGGTK